jgi:hypothetical protein
MTITMIATLQNPSNSPKIGPPIHAFTLSRSLRILVAITGVAGTPQMVFTNPIMTTHVNMTIDQPPMSSMATRGYKSTNAENLRRGY